VTGLSLGAQLYLHCPKNNIKKSLRLCAVVLFLLPQLLLLRAAHVSVGCPSLLLHRADGNSGCKLCLLAPGDHQWLHLPAEVMVLASRYLQRTPGTLRLGTLIENHAVLHFLIQVLTQEVY